MSFFGFGAGFLIGGGGGAMVFFIAISFRVLVQNLLVGLYLQEFAGIAVP